MNRWDLLNVLIRTFGYRSYLEIGLQYGDNFSRIICDRKVSVDCEARCGSTFVGTSDQFFHANRQLFDLVFIDGLHAERQVLRDAYNALRSLTSRGSVVLHDCDPREEWQQMGDSHPGGIQPWYGTAWKAWVRLRRQLACETFLVDADRGCGVIYPPEERAPPTLVAGELTWENLVRNRQEWIGVMREEEFIAWLEERGNA